jgi:hypothetical protein
VRLVAAPAVAPTAPRVSWRVWLVLICAAVVAVGIAALGDWRHAFHLQRRSAVITYPAAKIDTLVLSVPGGGDIHVRNGSASTVRLVQRTSTLAGVQIHAKRALASGTLTIRDSCAGRGFLGRAVCSADYDVTVPRGVALILSTVAGDVSIDDVAQPVRAKTVAGDIDASGCLPSVDVHSVAGDISVDTRCAPRTLFADTNVGDVDLVVPAGRYALTTDTHSGDVHVVGVVTAPGSPRIVRASTTGGDIDIQGRE